MDTTKSLKGTQTEKNIVSAYLNEAQAYARYTYYAQKANKENLWPVGVMFDDTAANELRHGKIFLGLLPGGQVEVPLVADAGVIGDTATNLQISIHEELVDGIEAYTKAAAVAREEGFPDIAVKFESIAKIEAHHHERFQRFLKRLQDGTLWKREKPIRWRCLVCGYIFEGTEPPQVCPACSHPYQHYIGEDDLN
ncbi:MAG: rubrerythrin family protein [Bacteroidales bacterium]|nr:rubrerythrin family protein [Bacteroidales bacterium]